MKAGRLFLSPPHMGGEEQRFVGDAFASNYIAPLGPMVDAFEQEFSAFTGIPFCVALASGTAATHLALRHLGVGAGDEVLASTLTFIGSITPVVFVGAKPVFIDCEVESWNMDTKLLDQELRAAAARGRLPKAVIPTDLYGQCCDLPQIRALCDRYEVPVICDAAEAVGSRYRPQTADHGPPTDPTTSFGRHAGVDAWAAVYSFNGNKIITTSGGGMLASHDKAMIDHARKLSQQARDPAPWYEHTEIGYNYRMSNVLAAIGRGQLRVLEERVRRKREVFMAYRHHFADVPGITFMPEPDWSRANRWLTVILIAPDVFGADTHAVREALERQNIESRPVWKPMHLQPVFGECRLRSAECGVETGRDAVARLGRKVVSEDLFDKGLCLPSGTAMTDEQIERVARIVRDVPARILETKGA